MVLLLIRQPHYDGNDTATWSFDVVPGTYRIAATWHWGHPVHGSDVPVTVFDGTTSIGTEVLNQKLSPDDFLSQSTWWEDIGTFTIWNSLRIVMSDEADGRPIADAFRVERISADAVPIASDDSYYTSLNTDLIVASTGTAHLLANDRAHDGMLMGATVVTQPTHGTLTAFDSKGGFTYRPNSGFVGVDRFTYQVQASNLEKTSATVSIAVGTPLLPRKNLDANTLNTSMPDPWLQMSLLDPAMPSSGFEAGYTNVPNGSSAETDGALAASGGLLLMENVAQDTMLDYRSDSLTKPIIAVETQLAPGLPLPTAMTAQLTFNGVAGTLYSFATSGLTAGQELRFALQADGTALPTGMVDYTIEINLTINGIPVTQSFSGKQSIVNRGASEFGNGWGLDGLDRLYEQSDGALIVRGNGDAYWFPLVSGNYAHADGDISFSRLEKLANNTFKLTSKYGVVSNFSAIGVLTSRVDANDNLVTYNYSSTDADGVADEIASITDPFGRTISFGYTGSQVTTINHYSGRQTTLVQAAGSLTGYTLADPDGNGPLPRPVSDTDYDSVGNVELEPDPRGNFSGRVPYTYDEDNRLITIGTSVAGVDARAVEYVYYDNIGRVTSISRVPYVSGDVPPQDPYPLPTDELFISYDSLGRIKERISRQMPNAGGAVWFRELFEYDLAGRLIETIDGEGNVAINQYDGRGLLIRESLPDPDGNGSQFPLVVAYQYDNMGRLITTDRGFGRKTHYEYNSRSWITKTTQPDPDGTGPATSPITYFAYNARGDLTSFSDAMSRPTTLVYDNEQRLITRVNADPDGTGPLLAPVSGWVYNANNWVTSTNDAVGATTTTQYDALGRVSSVLAPDPDGAGSLTAPLTQYVYNTLGLASVIDPMSHTTSYVRDNRGRVTAMTDTAGSLTEYEYDFYDNLRKHIAPDPDGAGSKVSPVTTFEYDAYDRLTKKFEPGADGSSLPPTVYSYDAASNLRFVTDPTNNTTEFVYDNLSRVKEEINSLGKSRYYTYDVAGNLTRTVDRNGRVVHYVYDALDRPIEEKWQSSPQYPTATVSTIQQGEKFNEEQLVGWTDPYPAITQGGTFTLTHGSSTTAPIPFDASAAVIQSALAALPNIGLGNVSVELTDKGVPADYSIHTFKLTFRAGLAVQNVPQTTVNTNGLVVQPNVPVPQTQQTTLQGSQVSEKQEIHIVSNGWNVEDGNWYLSYAGEVSEPLPKNASAIQVAAALNQFAGINNVSVIGSLGSFTITFGGTQTATNMQQIMVDVARLSNGSYAHHIDTGYNAVGEIVSVSEPSTGANGLRTINFTRDNLGRATTIASTHTTWNLASSTLTQKFDAVGNRTELSAKLDGTNDFKNGYTYDKLHRLTEVTQSGQAGATWVKPKRITQEFNSLGQRTKISRFESLTTANPVATTDFIYDFANRLDGIAHKQGTTNLNTYSYAYDPLSRLSSVTSTADGLTDYAYDQRSQLVGVDNALNPDESFSYDAGGNRNMAGYTTTDDNRTTAGDGWTYTYDDEGNMTQANNGSQYWTYTWDYRNRLVEAKLWPGYTETYEYDAFNRLVRAGTISYIYDEGINPIMEYNGSGPRKYYLWSDAVDDLLAAEQVVNGSTHGNILWPLADHLGTIGDIADRNDSTGVTTVTNHRRYDSFGQLKSETNPAVDLIFGYTGKQFDEFTGLQNNLNRWYNPRLGKFISQDPIGFAGGDANLYRYVGNRATSYVDPYGLADAAPDESGGNQAEPGFANADGTYIIFWPGSSQPIPLRRSQNATIGACDSPPMTAERTKQYAMLELQYQIRQSQMHGRSAMLLRADLINMQLHPASPALPLVWFGPQDAGYGSIWDGVAFIGGFAPGMNPIKTAAGAGYPYRVGVPSNPIVATAPLNPRAGRLVVGGGRAAGFPALSQGDVTLNISSDSRAHITGDIRTINPSKIGTFNSVFFERVPFDILDQAAFRNAAGMLSQGGKLRILTGRAASRNSIRECLEKSGFVDVQMNETFDRALEVNARLGGLR